MKHLLLRSPGKYLTRFSEVKRKFKFNLYIYLSTRIKSPLYSLSSQTREIRMAEQENRWKIKLTRQNYFSARLPPTLYRFSKSSRRQTDRDASRLCLLANLNGTTARILGVTFARWLKKRAKEIRGLVEKETKSV